MFDKKMKAWLIILIVVFLIFMEKAQEKTLADKFFATAQKVSAEESSAYAVQVNGETVFQFPEDAIETDSSEQAQTIADQMNELFRENKDPVIVKPYLNDDGVVIRIGDQPIVTIEDSLAKVLKSTTTAIAMEWVDNLNGVIEDGGVYLGRAIMQRGSARLESGRASWYGGSFHGRRTANGETFDENALTAAHRTLPFGTVVLVTNMANGRSVVVRINDRGPFSPGRHIDLSKRAAEDIGMIRSGTAAVKLEVLTAYSSVARQ